MQPRALGIRAKLIIIFVLIKVLPLVVLAWFAWSQIERLGHTVDTHNQEMIADTRAVVGEVGQLSTQNSIHALDLRSREAIERLTTDTARAVAAFLHDRDQDILQAAALEPTPAAYARFLAERTRPVTDHRPWILNRNDTAWEPSHEADPGPVTEARLADNVKEFHSRPPEPEGIVTERPLYLEMTFIGLDGKERFKAVTSKLVTPEPRDITRPENTWCKAERYFDEIKALGPHDIYVSEVVGAAVGTNIIGLYTPQRAKELDVPFEPEKAGYAGKENPVGRRFQGLVRWAAPVRRQGRLLGWVTLGLDHTHIMEFTDHLVPTEERYSPIADAASGNYAFMWDYKNRCISHARDFFIVGYDPDTGLPAPPWMDTDMYQRWQDSGLSITEFLAKQPVFDTPSLKKKGSADMIRQGWTALDGRYLNFAPQCAGWHNLTKDGGSGSFVIFWSGLWKLTTAAAIPYHTGRYSGPKGFGFVTIGANVHEFHRSATETAREIEGLVTGFEKHIDQRKRDTQLAMKRSLGNTARTLTTSTAIMAAIVIVIAVWMASWLTRRITEMVQGIRSFQDGDLTHRLTVVSGDEMGQLATAFNEMADTILEAMDSLKEAESKYRTIFENAVEGIFQSTPSGRFVRVNPAMAAIFGYDSPEQMIREVKKIAVQLYVSAADREEFLRRVRQRGEIIGFETRFLRRDGSQFWAEISARAVKDDNGEVVYSEGIIQDITERLQARETLHRAIEEAEAASRMKSDFLSMVSHELRTPLTSVLGFAKMIHKKLIGSVFPHLDDDDKAARAADQVRQNLEIILAEGERLTHLINEVLDLTKLEAGRIDWNMGPVDVHRLVERALAGAEALMVDKDLQLTRDVPKGLPPVHGDMDRLIQVLINLVSNAIKFTDTGTITCRAEKREDEIVFSVTDTGQGIPTAFQEQVFHRFSQLGDLLTEKPKGSGLGLTICKEIVSHHGGRIWLRSQPGKGSTFSFAIPVYRENGN